MTGMEVKLPCEAELLLIFLYEAVEPEWKYTTCSASVNGWHLPAE